MTTTTTPITEKENIYTENGYKNRHDYLSQLSNELGIEKSIVFSVAFMLGENEDFDGLLTSFDCYL